MPPPFAFEEPETTEFKMPVPTPRTIPPIEEPEPEIEEEEDIPDDWKDTGEILEIKRCKPLKIDESVVKAEPWTQTIPEEELEEPLEVIETKVEPKVEAEELEAEINVKEMKEFWEVATSPIKLSPIASPAQSPPVSWKSMPNLAKDMATQTTISASTSESSGSDTESEKELPEPENHSKLLKPLEERKKAFILQDAPLPWKSMPSLNKDTTTKPTAPLPLVGSCYPTKLEDITLEQPLNQIKQKFESKIQLKKPKSNFLEEPKRLKPASSLSSLNSGGGGADSGNNSDIVALEENQESIILKDATSTTPVVYRWDDESNGEIYTDRPIIDATSSNQADCTSTDVENVNETTTENSIGLYVVENGKEYPLVPLKLRKSLFEPNPVAKISFKNSPVPVKEPKMSKPVTIVTPEEVVKIDKVEIEAPKVVEKEVIKSSVMPYILEEQEVLQNINLVSKIKTKFACEK